MLYNREREKDRERERELGGFFPVWAQQPSPFKTIRGGIFVILCY